MGRGKLRFKRVLYQGAIALGMLLVVAYLVATSGIVLSHVWTREVPLANAIIVKEVRDGVITLENGKRVRPAGVIRREGVTSSDFDSALRTIVAQGVVITQECGDDRVLLMAEPRFYNWCGTAGYNGRRWQHWAGEYRQCPVSELMVLCGYAAPHTNESGLTAKQLRRIDGVQREFGLKEVAPCPMHSNALRFDGRARMLTSGVLDEMIDESECKVPR